MNTIFGTKTHFKFVVTYKNSRCLKITEKIAFNTMSEASYVYIMSGQKFMKNAKNSQIWRVFQNLKLAVKQCYQIGHFFNSTKIGEKCQNVKNSNATFFVDFQTL